MQRRGCDLSRRGVRNFIQGDRGRPAEGMITTDLKEVWGLVR